MFGSKADLLAYAEAYWDDRRSSAPTTAFDRDLVVGCTLFLNDARSSEFESRVVFDVVAESLLFDLAHRQRIGEDLTIDASLSAPLNARRDDALETFQDDAVFRLGLRWHF